jgi:hypothetical protein
MSVVLLDGRPQAKIYATSVKYECSNVGDPTTPLLTGTIVGEGLSLSCEVIGLSHSYWCDK